MVTFEITIQRKSTVGWPVVVEQSAPGQFLPMRIEGLLQLDLEILRAQSTPLDYGRVLGQALFAGPVRDAFVQALAASGNALRVLLCVEDDGLKTLHWQRLCGPLDGGWSFLSLQQRTLFSLYLPAVTDRRFPAIGRLDLRALVVVASPAGLEKYGLQPFDAAETVTTLAKAFGAIPCDFLADAPGAVGPPTLDAFCERIVAERYTLVHVVCHGATNAREGETSLFLAAPGGGLDRVDGTRLVQRLGQLDAAAGLPHVVFLAACETASPGAEDALGGLAQRLVRELGTPAVIAMSDLVSLSTAQALAAGFYARLAQHGEVDRALTEASAALAERGDVTVPALYSRLGNRALFSQAPDRPVTPTEIAAGLDKLRTLLPERAPVLVPRLDALAATLRAVPGADPTQLSPTARAERGQALADLDALCLEVLDLDFRALAFGQPPPPYDDRCPFRGLASFRPEDRGFFFGREALTARLAGRLRGERFLALVGGSGCGKSSLALAGVGPVLQGQLPGARLLSMTPGREPVRTLDALLGDTAAGGAVPAVLVVDQAEEAFTMVQDEAERRAFFERLAGLTQQDGEPLYVLVTLRAEFLGDAAPYAELRQLLQTHQELVAPMDAGELRGAMEQQARAVGLRFEADLANTLLDDVAGEPGAMPLLQHALLELWHRRHGRWLRAEEYRAIGGVRQAIAHTADALYLQLDSADQTRARRLFLRLVRVDEGPDHRDTRRRAALDDLARDEADRTATVALVNRLADARLVVTSVNPLDGCAEVELAHETLITAWGRLQGWIEQDRAGLVVRQRLAEDARTWERGGRKGDYLYRRAQLEPAQQWNAAHPDDLTPLEAAFLVASQRQQRVGMVRRVAVAAALVVVPVLVALAIMRVTDTGPFRLADIAWSKALSDFYVADIEWSTDGQMFLGSGGGEQARIAKSADGGQQWTMQTMPGDWVFDVAADPARPDRLVAVPAVKGPSGGILLQPTVLLTSEDGGGTWRNATSAPLPFAVLSLAFGSDGTLYAGGMPVQSQAGEVVSPVQRSMDGGLTWQAVEQPPGDLQSVFHLEPYGDGILAGGMNGLYAWSARAGWSTVLPAEFSIIDQFASDGGTIYAGGYGGSVHKIGSDGVPITISPLKMTSIVPLRGQPALFLAATNEGTLLWWPSGATSVNVEKPTEAFQGAEQIRLSVDPQTPGRIWAGTTQGLFLGEAKDWITDRR